MNLSHFIVGHDGSTHADHALELAATLGAPLHATLTVVYVRHFPFTLAASASATLEYSHSLDETASHIRVYVAGALKEYESLWTFEERHGNPAHELIEAAAAHQADAIVVGHRGHRAVTDVILGSVASDLVHHSPINVVIGRRSKDG